MQRGAGARDEKIGAGRDGRDFRSVKEEAAGRAKELAKGRTQTHPPQRQTSAPEGRQPQTEKLEQERTTAERQNDGSRYRQAATGSGQLPQPATGGETILVVGEHPSLTEYKTQSSPGICERTSLSQRKTSHSTLGIDGDHKFATTKFRFIRLLTLRFDPVDEIVV
jgi:hypothetical protein